MNVPSWTEKSYTPPYLATTEQMLSGDDEYTQEDLDKMTEWFGQVQDWVDQVKADLNIE